MDMLRNFANAAVALVAPQMSPLETQAQRRLGFGPSPGVGAIDDERGAGGIDSPGDASDDILDSPEGRAGQPQRTRVYNFTCFCPCGLPGRTHRLSSVAHVRHQQLNALGLTATMRHHIRQTFLERWKGGALLEKEHDIAAGPPPGTPGGMWRLGVMADKHFENYNKVGGVPHIPTMRYDVLSKEFMPVTTLPGSVGPTWRVATPRTPNIHPAQLELEKLTCLQKRKRLSHEQLIESGGKVLRRMSDLEAKVLDNERTIKALQERLEKNKRNVSIPQWQEVAAGAFSPAIRFEHMEKSRSLCESVFGYPGPVLRSLHDLVNFNGLLSDTPLYSAERMKGIVSANPGGVRVASTAPTTAETFLPVPMKAASGRNRKLDTLNQFALTLSLLHSDLPLTLTGALWGMSSSTVSSIFTTTIIILDKFFFHVLCPPMSAERAFLCTPLAHDKKVGNSVAAFAGDCMEKKAALPTNGLINSYYFSEYKNGPTHKLLILANIGGVVVYVSDCYSGGRANDTDVLRAEWANIMRHVPRGSVLYFDKGFLPGDLQDLLVAHGVEIRIPDRKNRGQAQFSAQSTLGTQMIANTRIVVECIISRVSSVCAFVKGSSTVPEADLQSAALRVCFMLSNLFPPLTQGGSIPSDIHARELKEIVTRACAGLTPSVASTSVRMEEREDEE